ncbi:MAG: hypothetical protein M0P71_13680 [Melioribacteraceae bacterium]|nr:hypothetical protein [Melioribacteraceae bacterium]
MKKNLILWLIAFIITVSSAIYQRLTGPTYPISGEAKISNSEIQFKLDRSHGGEGDHIITIDVSDKDIKGNLVWKRFKSHDQWENQEMVYKEGKLLGILPHQPPAGKIIYHIELSKNNMAIHIPNDEQNIIRFKGDVPIWILIPHVIVMFGAMLVSTRAGLEILNQQNSLDKLVAWTLALAILGGLIFGPIVQYFAFGALWTGVPFGWDLTDNKTLIAVIVWVIAWFKMKNSDNPYLVALIASVVMLIVFLIPHSVLGSEIDHTKINN